MKSTLGLKKGFIKESIAKLYESDKIAVFVQLNKLSEPEALSILLSLNEAYQQAVRDRGSDQQLEGPDPVLTNLHAAMAKIYPDASQQTRMESLDGLKSIFKADS